MRRSLGRRTLVVAAAAIMAGAALASGQGPATAPRPAPPSGERLFRTYCASCHGPSGKGDGPVARYLRRPLPDLTRLAKHGGGAFRPEPIARMIDGRKPIQGHGGAEMPVWGEAFQGSGDSESEAAVKRRIQALVDYLESVQAR